MLKSLIESFKKIAGGKNEWVEGKNIQCVLEATNIGDKRLSVLFTSLEPHLSSLEWVDALKALTTVHYIIQEDSSGDILHYLARHLHILSPCFSLNALPHGEMIQRYAKYLVQRILLCNSAGAGRMRRLEFNSEKATIDERFLDETESIHQVLSVAVECHMSICITNKFLNTASRLLVSDVQMLFQALSKRLVCMLENFLKLPKSIMGRTARLYNKFTGQTRAVERCLNLRLRGENKAAIKLLPLKPLPALADLVLKLDSEASWSPSLIEADTKFDTAPCNQIIQPNQVVEKELPETPIVDWFSDFGHSAKSYSIDLDPKSDVGSESDLIDFC